MADHQFTEHEQQEAGEIAARLVSAVEVVDFDDWHAAEAATLAVLRGLAEQERRVHGDTRTAATLDLIAAAVEQGR